MTAKKSFTPPAPSAQEEQDAKDIPTPDAERGAVETLEDTMPAANPATDSEIAIDKDRTTGISEHWIVQVDPDRPDLIRLAPRYWVGPTPIVFHRSVLGELSDLLVKFLPAEES